MNSLWKWIFILIIMLPIGGSDYSWLNFLQIKYEVSILDVIFTLMLISELFLLKPPFKVKKKKLIWICACFFTIFVFVYTIIKSFRIYNVRAIRDSFNYLMCLEFLMAPIIMKNRGITYKDIIDWTATGYIGFTIVTLMTYIGYNQIGSRVGGNCFSLSIVLIPYAIYKILQNKSEKNRKSLIIILCFIINAIITQNRTAIFFVVISVLYVFALEMRNNVSLRKIQKFAIMVVIGIFAVLILVATKAEVIVRIVTGGEIDTFAGRVNTFNYYFNLIKEKPSGYGFGFIMHFFTAGNYQLPLETYQIDNAFVVYGIKGGVLMLILFSVLALIPLKANLTWNLKEKKIFRCSYLFLLVATYVMTSQIIQGRSTALFIWFLVGLTIQNMGKGFINCEDTKKFYDVHRKNSNSTT